MPDPYAPVRGLRPRLLACLVALLAVGADAQDRRGGEIRALQVGTVHPISGPPIEDGMIVMRGGDILAVASAEEIDLPPGVEVMSYPDAHAYPGLVDALSVAFGDDLVLQDASSDAGTKVVEGLDPYRKPSQELVRYGVTTIYVSNRGATTWRGMGAVLHPQVDGFAPAEGEAASAAAVNMRVHGGSDETHPLDRQKALRDLGKPFGELKSYAKAKRKHDEALEEYAKEYEEYLEFFRKKNEGAEEAAPTDESGEAEAKDEPQPAEGEGEESGEAEEPAEEKPAEEQPEEEPAEETPTDGEEPAAEAEEPAAENADDDAESAEDEAPEKPEYPTAPDPDPAKDALMEVADGNIALHVEARRLDEIRAALAMRREHEVPRMVLELADEAGALARDLADAGIPVIATGFADAGRPADSKRFSGDLPATLATAGVEVAIASGSVRGARQLPLLAAYASGRGLDEEAAVAAITLVPAKILGMSRRVGSLESGKRADILVTSGPLLRSDTVTLAVLSGGQTQFEKK